MTVTSLAAVVAPRKGKIIKMVSVFLKEQKIRYKMVLHGMIMVYYTLCLGLSQSSEIVLQNQNSHRRISDLKLKRLIMFL